MYHTYLPGFLPSLMTITFGLLLFFPFLMSFFLASRSRFPFRMSLSMVARLSARSFGSSPGLYPAQ
jgi:hypothetical protein